MNKQQFINALSEHTGFNKTDCNRYLDAYFKVMQDTLIKGELVKFVGFGTYSVVDRKKRHGVNPQTQEKLIIPAGKRIRFTPSINLKAAVNEKKTKK